MLAYPVVLLQHELVPLILATHSEHLPLEVVHLLCSLVAVLHHLLLHLLLHELLLGKPLPLRLFSLTLLELASLLVLQLPATALLFLPRSHECRLLLPVLLEHASLLGNIHTIW